MFILTNRVILAFFLLTILFNHAAAQSLLSPGEAFPEFNLPTPESSGREYLGLPDKKTFTPSQIDCDLLLVELLNVHCLHCQQQAHIYNRLFERIENSTDRKEKIKILGIAVGNVPEEVENFKQQYSVDFPILTDADFAIWRRLGAGSTPLAIYVRQIGAGQAGIITGLHKGLSSNDHQLYQTLVGMAAISPEEYREMKQSADLKIAETPPILSPSELEFKVRSAFTRRGVIEDFSVVPLLSGKKVYTALVRNGEKTVRLFAEVTSRPSICDICHDVHFFYLFDRTARVLDFEPLHLTKYGNIEWDKEEVETMRKRVVGKYLTMPQPFDPSLDAISTATMTSAIIFDSLAQGEKLITELKQQGML